jgi:hypothetical protein
VTLAAFCRDPAAVLVAVSVLLYTAATVAFGLTARPWLGVMYLGYTIGAVASVMIALGYR